MERFETQKAVNDVIAENLKKLRRDRHLSLDRVSEMTGVSKSMLGQIERSESSPTISTLWKIATGLHVSFTSLLEKPVEDAVIIRNEDLAPLSSDQEHFRLFPVFPSEKNRPFEILYIELDPGAVSASSPHEAGTEEFVLVFAGQIEILLGGANAYRLSEGTSIRYRADQAHQYCNPSNQPARMCMVIYYNEISS
jgi:transcriptional regulator with XRE-family HTH domain